MSKISFESIPYSIKDWIIVRLPDDASLKLPSRGQVMVTGTINGYEFQTPLEPDGEWGHWFRVEDDVAKLASVKVGEPVKLQIEPTKKWPEPDVPADIQAGLKNHPKAHELWQKVTPLAHWEWIRWIRGTHEAETRKKRIEVACSKMESGERRPCCWNRNACSEPYVSKSGKLLSPVSAIPE